MQQFKLTRPEAWKDEVDDPAIQKIVQESNELLKRGGGTKGLGKGKKGGMAQ